MLPPLQTDIKCNLSISQLSILKESISQVIRGELMPLRVLIEGSAKDIDARFLNFEDRLRTALEPHSFQAAQKNIIADVTADSKSDLFVGIDKDSKQLEDIGIQLGFCFN